MGDIYKLDENNLLSTTKSKTIQPSSSQKCGGFGHGFAMDENTAALALDKEDNKEVGVEIFEKNQDGVDKWGDVKVVRASDKANFSSTSKFAQTLSVDGDYVVVGDWGKSTDDDSGDDDKKYRKGCVYIFKKNYPTTSEKWGELKMIHEPGTYGFGTSVELKGDYLCVGCIGDDMDDENSDTHKQPGVYIYKKDKDGVDNWGYVTKLITSDRTISPTSSSSGGSPKQRGKDLPMKFDGTTLVIQNRI